MYSVGHYELSMEKTHQMILLWNVETQARLTCMKNWVNSAMGQNWQHFYREWHLTGVGSRKKNRYKRLYCSMKHIKRIEVILESRHVVNMRSFTAACLESELQELWRGG